MDNGMRNRFLITGLPRSRTAWMAAFMTYGNTICLHEPRNWKAMWAANTGQNVGISDSGLGFSLYNIMKEYAPRVLIIDRPLEDVEKSLESLKTGLPKTNFCKILHGMLSEVPKHKDIMRVPYHMLNDLRTMEKAFWHLNPGEAFDEGRFLSMKDINIQVDICLKMKEPIATHYDFPLVVREEG